MLIRAQEMARYVSDGALDAGLTARLILSTSRRRTNRRHRAWPWISVLQQSFAKSGGSGGVG
jgi:hypothetical protein